MKYQLNEYGFITNYLVSGRKETDFSSSAADKNQLACEKMMRSEAADHDPVMPAGPIVLGALDCHGSTSTRMEAGLWTGLPSIRC